MSDASLLSELREKHPFLEERESLDLPAFRLPPEQLEAFSRSLRDRFGFDLLVDVTAVDWFETSPRFTVVYHVYSTSRHGYLRYTVDCPKDDEPEVPSLADVWPAANWHERETFDMFGIRFSGHPDLRRILMWDEYPYFPLRKDFPLAGFETEIPGAESGEKMEAKMIAAPMMGGPFVAPSHPAMSESEPRAKDQSWSEKNPKPKK